MNGWLFAFNGGSSQMLYRQFMTALQRKCRYLWLIKVEVQRSGLQGLSLERLGQKGQRIAREICPNTLCELSRSTVWRFDTCRRLFHA